MWRRAVAAGAAVLTLVGGPMSPSPSCGQIPCRDPLPWLALGDSLRGPALVVEAARSEDGRTGWTARCFRTMGLLPRGSGGLLFFRLPIWAVDTADSSVIERWPALMLPEQTDWPGESRSAGAGSPEIGWLGPLRLPLLGRAQAGVAAALPLGRDALYPFASTSASLRLLLRRPFTFGKRCELGLLGGGVVALGATGDRLDGSAYPSGASAAIDMTWRGRDRRSLTLLALGEWGGGARMIAAGVGWRFPMGGGTDLALGLRHVLGEADDRPYAVMFTVGMTIADGPREAAGVAK